MSQIARELGRDRKTVRKWLKEEEPGNYIRRTQIPLKIDPYRVYILQRMQEGCVNAVVLYDEIHEMGYTGGITQLRNFMRPHRPVVQSRASMRFETAPGEQAQVDWGSFSVDWHQRKKRLYAFVMVLGYSRMMYVEFTENEKLETLMGCPCCGVLWWYHWDLSVRQHENRCCDLLPSLHIMVSNYSAVNPIVHARKARSKTVSATSERTSGHGCGPSLALRT